MTNKILILVPLFLKGKGYEKVCSELQPHINKFNVFRQGIVN
jgi:hypothetical protein